MMGDRGDVQGVDRSPGREDRPIHNLVGDAVDFGSTWQERNPFERLEPDSGEYRIARRRLVNHVLRNNQFIIGSFDFPLTMG